MIYTLINIDITKSTIFQVELRTIDSTDSIFMSIETYERYYKHETKQ